MVKLRAHYPIRIDLTMDESLPSGATTINVSTKVQSGHNTENPLDWRVQLSLEIFSGTKEQPRFRGHIEMVGYFDIAAESKPESRSYTVTANGASVLYAAARELVLTITSRIPQKSITLPMMSFANIKTEASTSPEAAITVSR